MSIHLEVDLAAIKQNFSTLQELAHGAECAPVLKARAYGLDPVRIAKELCGYTPVKKIFVATAPEGAVLRTELLKDGFEPEIYVLDGLTKSANDHDKFKKFNLSPVLATTHEVISWLKMGFENIPTALQVNLGFNRLGVDIKELGVLTETGFNPNIVLGHLTSADEIENPVNQQERAVFLEACKYFPEAKKSLSASEGVFQGKDFCFDIIRPGIGLYGPFLAPGNLDHDKLTNSVRISAQILQKRRISKGSYVGYNRTWTAKEDTWVVIANIGYADGVSSCWAREGKLSFYHPKTGQMLPVVGKVSMDTTIMRLSDDFASQIKEGDEITLVGEKRNLADIADEIKVSPHEVLTSLGNGPRMTKTYHAK